MLEPRKSKNVELGGKEDKPTLFVSSHEPRHFEKSEVNVPAKSNPDASCSLLSRSCYFTALELTQENTSSSPEEEELELAQKKQPEAFLLAGGATEAESVSVCAYEDSSSYFGESGTERNGGQLESDPPARRHSGGEGPVGCGASYGQEASRKNRTNVGGPWYIKALQNASSKLGSSTFDKYFSGVSEQPRGSQDGRSAASDSWCPDLEGRCVITGPLGALAHRERNSESLLASQTVSNEKTVASSFIDLAHTSVAATHRASWRQTDRRSTDAFQRSKSSCVLKQEQTFLPPAHTCSSDTDVSCVCKRWVLPKAPKRNEADKPRSHYGRCKESFPNSEPSCIKYPNNGTDKNQSTVSQAVDASTDFRACFTTSRATNANVPLVSRGQNTMMTMANKYWPEEWMTEKRKSVACNTDWSCASGCRDTSESQMPFENSTTQHRWESVNEDSLASKTSTSKDFNEMQARLMLLSQEITSPSPNCCKDIWERAIKAEMQLLKIWYQMYNSWQTYNSVAKEKEQGNSSAHGIGNSVPQISSTRDVETSSNLLVPPALGESGYPQLSLCNDNSEERKTVLEEKRSSHAQEAREDWFDAAENLTGSEPSLPLKEAQATEEREKEAENILCVCVVDCLSPLVSEVDLWLCFQRYNVSDISISEHSNNCRYAFLSFKTACDAKLAVKEMDGKEIRGQAVKVQLIKITPENRTPHCLNFPKKHEKQGAQPVFEEDVECKKNCNLVPKMPGSSPGDPNAGCATSPLKSPNASNDSFRSALSSPANPPRVLSAPSKTPHSDDGQTTKPTSGTVCYDVDQEDIAEGFSLLGSVHGTPNPSGTFVPPNGLSLRSFHKIVKKLEELHPESSRDAILNALVEIKETKGSLSGLPLRSIIQMASGALSRKRTSKGHKDQGNKPEK